MTQAGWPPLPDGFEYRLDLRHHVTSRLLREEPVHRWFFFPHSFSSRLIDEVLKRYPLPSQACILDPFVGAGTTVLRARELGYVAVGTDLSPLSVFVSRVKLQTYDRHRLEEHLRSILNYRPAGEVQPTSKRISRAFTPGELSHIIGLRRGIDALPDPEAGFFRLALLRTMQRLSRAVPNGGWFRWVEKPDQSEVVADLFAEQAAWQIDDVREYGKMPESKIFLCDARHLDAQRLGTFDLVVTSPPYPNRHDYSRVFHIELLALGITEQEIRRLRHQSIRSHVEAKPPGARADGYVMPRLLQEVLSRLPAKIDPRVVQMLKGYFEDMYLVLRQLYALLSPGGVCALVVGNVRYAGVMVPVDEILVDIASQVGFAFDAAWVARLRGNSAQQMGRFCREPSRESIVYLRKR